LRVDLFDFELPAGRIAEYPAEPRESARLLLVQPNGLADQQIGDLPTLLRPDDLLVFNDTKVIPARLIGLRGSVRVDMTLHKPHAEPGCWHVFARPGKRLRPGDIIQIADDFSATVVSKGDGGQILMQFSCIDDALLSALDCYGSMPLPPYIRRAAEAADHQRYQTIFARHAGAVAAPTAGLHFTPDLLGRLDAAGIERVMVTLHVGAGTFLPVKVDDTNDHVMHSEWGEVSAAAAARIRDAAAAGRRIVAIGTTALRILESAAAVQNCDAVALQSFAGDTSLFITPGYRFRVVDRLFTNFHLPRSTLFMLVSAFAGLEKMRAAYAHAIAGEYRFFSYGDACLLERTVP